ncbi:fumarate hydratase class I, aerobic-like isoform X1 [Branchiostoma lanceolatum]|uniref:fumarate hydratase class I, aerobic-like isoform X1 n=1 Tax=Branchiostoma lanceolatum TaxID=7740 RepID=UPI003451560C
MLGCRHLSRLLGRTQLLPHLTRAKATAAAPGAKSFFYQDVFEPEKPLDTPYRKLTGDYVSTFDVLGKTCLKVEPEALTLLTQEAMVDIAHLLRPAHLAQLRKILDDPEASPNDKYVAMEFLKNANIAAAKVLPGCQDTGTAIVMGKKGQYVWTDGKDEEHLARGIYNTYTQKNLRYSQVAPLDMYTEANTKTNLPAQIELYATGSDTYNFMFIAKGGGSANKTFLYQQTKALLNPEKLTKFIDEKIKTLGTAACPPYHLAIVVGGLSAEMTLKTVKLASTKYLDSLPTSGNEHGRAFRDVELEEKVHQLSQVMGMGAQFGGKYFCHDVRVVRLPRHGASCPVGIGVSCSADRQALGKITADGVFLEQLEEDPSKYLPEISSDQLSGDVVQVNLNQPMSEVLKILSQYPVRTRLSLSGTMVVARDIAHAKIQDLLDSGQPMPQYLKDHPVYYAGPAKTPEGYASGSLGPTTAGRMDSYVDSFQQQGGSMVMLAKGNRSKQVTKACKKYGGFYLGSIGGPAAVLAEHSIKKLEVLEYPELGMEAIWKVDVENFPAFIVVDNKGNDFFKEWQTE